MGRYPFGVELFHLLLHAGLSRRFHKIDKQVPDDLEVHLIADELRTRDELVHPGSGVSGWARSV